MFRGMKIIHFRETNSQLKTRKGSEHQTIPILGDLHFVFLTAFHNFFLSDSIIKLLCYGSGCPCSSLESLICTSSLSSMMGTIIGETTLTQINSYISISMPFQILDIRTNSQA